MIYVVEDCCGDVSVLAHENAMKRMIQAGAKPVTALSVMLEWQRDWTERDTYDAVMDIVKNHSPPMTGNKARRATSRSVCPDQRPLSIRGNRS